MPQRVVGVSFAEFLEKPLQCRLLLAEQLLGQSRGGRGRKPGQLAAEPGQSFTPKQPAQGRESLAEPERRPPEGPSPEADLRDFRRLGADALGTRLEQIIGGHFGQDPRDRAKLVGRWVARGKRLPSLAARGWDRKERSRLERPVGIEHERLAAGEEDEPAAGGQV